MTREIMKEIKELITKGHSGREIVAMGYAETTVRKVGDMMTLRGELPGITETIREELLRADSAEIFKQIRRELRERGFKQGSMNAVVSQLRRKRVGMRKEALWKKYLGKVAQLWEEYKREKAELQKEYEGKTARLRKEYEGKTARLWEKYNKEKPQYEGKIAPQDKIKALEKEIEVRDRLLKKLMKRLNQERGGQ